MSGRRAQPRASAVFAITTNDVYAVGSAGAILHWDSGGWTRIASPVTATLVGVWALDAAPVFIAATTGDVLVGHAP